VIRPFRVSGTSPGWSRTAGCFGNWRDSPKGESEKWLPSRRRNPAGSRIRLMGSTERGPGGECRPAFAFSGGLLVGGLDPVGHVAVLAIDLVDLFKLIQRLRLFPHLLERDHVVEVTDDQREAGEDPQLNKAIELLGGEVEPLPVQ